MRISNTTAAVLSHTIAGLLSAGLITTIPVALYAGSAMLDNDPGGPLTIVMIPLLALALGVGTTLILYFPCAVLFLWLGRRMRVPVWLVLLIFFLLSILFSALLGIITVDHPPPLGSLAMAGIIGTFFTSGFVIYLLVLMFSRRCLQRLSTAA